MPYCSFSDLIAHGAPRGATPNPGRPLASAESNTCYLDQHEFQTGDAVILTPAGAGAMPAGLSEGVTYYAEYVSDGAFKLRATAGGNALTFTDATDPLVVIAPLNRAAAIEWADRLIDDMQVSQAVPFDDAALYPDGVPRVVAITSAELAAWKLLAQCGASSRSFADVFAEAQKRLDRWGKGAPVKGTPEATRANQATAAPPATSVERATSGSDPRGWRRWGML